MKIRDAKAMLAVLWIAAATVGLMLAAVPLADDDPPARLLALLLVAASMPFGLMRPAIPALWAVALAWPTVVIRLAQDAGWQAVLLLVYTLIGVYAGDWIATWWAEKHPRLPAGRHGEGDGSDGRRAADGSSTDVDGLPPAPRPRP